MARFEFEVSAADFRLDAVLNASAIAIDVGEARGYRWVTSRSVLSDLGFSDYQQRTPGLLLPTHSVDGSGVVGYQFRPERPRRSDDKAIKYETPAGTQTRLDCNPLALADLADVSVPLFITEGVKKADAAISEGLCCLALAGVWNWKGGAEPDWDHVPLKGRLVYVAYDSDVMTNPKVLLALEALTTFLALRGAVVRWIVPPIKEDNNQPFGDPPKVGVDDWFVGGGTVAGLLALATVPRLSVVVNGDLWQGTERAIAGMQIQNDPPWLFHFGERELVEVVGGRRTAEVTKDRLTTLASRHLRSVKATDKGPVNADPKPTMMSNFLASWDVWPFPDLQRITGTPTFAPDGSLRTEPGYHTASQALYVPDDGLTIRPVPARPNRWDVKRAVDLLVNQLFVDFPFTGDADRAHAVAMALEPFARDLIRGVTPLYVADAPKQGTGKTLLVRSALGPAFGTVEGGISEPHLDEELEKRITAAMLAGLPFFFIDNVTQIIKWQSLSAALTKATWEGRKLGVSEVVSVPNRMLWVLTGNNPQFTDDLARRVVLIRMDSGHERPEIRSGFRHSLPAWSQVDGRSDLIWACCVLIQHWIARGRPGPSAEVPPFGSFSAWRRVMGGILHAAGITGFLGNQDRQRRGNEEAAGFGYLLGELHRLSKGAPFTVNDVYDRVVANNAQLEGVVDPGGRKLSEHGMHIALGRYLAAHTDQIAGGLKLTSLAVLAREGTKQYQVRPMPKPKGATHG